MALQWPATLRYLTTPEPSLADAIKDLVLCRSSSMDTCLDIHKKRNMKYFCCVREKVELTLKSAIPSQDRVALSTQGSMASASSSPRRAPRTASSSQSWGSPSRFHSEPPQGPHTALSHGSPWLSLQPHAPPGWTSQLSCRGLMEARWSLRPWDATSRQAHSCRHTGWFCS